LHIIPQSLKKGFASQIFQHEKENNHMGNNTNNTKSFLAMNAGTYLDKNGKAAPYAFLVEGIVIGVGTFREASEGKPAILNLSVLVGRNPWNMMGKDVEAEQANNPAINAEHPFVSLAVFGKDAARLKDIQKSSKVIFCGRPVKNSYKKKQTGEDVTTVVVNVDCIYQAQTKHGEADALHRMVPSVTNSYETRQGEARTQSLGMISCEVVKYNGYQMTPSGREVSSATVRMAVPTVEAEARINRTYNKETNYGNYMEATLSVWGSRASKMEKVLAANNQLVVTASAKKTVADNGLTYVDFAARDISVLKWGTRTGGAAPAGNSANAAVDSAPGAEGTEEPAPDGFAYLMDEDDGLDDLPF